jgi:threonine/homoserine/homoserine lactone efflux protein
MDIVLKGAITGLLLSLFVGATFFMLIETSMTRGFKASLWFDAGVLFCDATIIAVVYFFAAWINRMIVHSAYFDIAGGLIFMGFGVNYIVRRQKNDTHDEVGIRNTRVFMNGFFINLLNPSVVIFWLGTVALAITQLKYTGSEILLYFASALVVVALTDILKAYFAFRLSRFLRPSILRRIYVISGVMMILLGGYIIFK